jgi:dihydrodipicolinate synthase/N-acetylneuraminate lyase
MQVLEALAMGANGYLSTMSNIAPRLIQRVVSSYAAGDYDDSHAAWYQLMRLKQRIYSLGVNPAPLIKTATECLGMSGAQLRSPHAPIDSGVRETLAAHLDDFRDDIG